MAHGLYSDTEVQSAVKELFSYERFTEGMKAFLPKELSEGFLAKQTELSNSFDFQAEIVQPLLLHLKEISMTELTSSGLDHLDKTSKHLFISNHRDIGLDSAFLNLQLFDHGFETSQIAIGDNLMKHRVAELIFRINKSFVVQRSGSPRELYKASTDLSSYIRRTVESGKDSIWIAQREGRAKDGNDFTQVALLKMLGLSGGKNLLDHFSALNIVPVAISYEYDPCDALKTKEFIDRKNDSSYKKSFDADMKAILQGLKGKKGKVNIAFGKPIKSAIDSFSKDLGSKEILSNIAALIDEQIHQLYDLNPINYIAYDILNSSEQNIDKYTAQEKSQALVYFKSRLGMFNEKDIEFAWKYLLGIYANPVSNKIKA